MPAILFGTEQKDGLNKAATPGLSAVAQHATPWLWPQRVAFRAAFTWFLLTIWIWLDELAVRPTRPIQKMYTIFSRYAVDFLARHLLHTTQVYQPNSFRDTHYLYLLLLGCLFLTAAATLLWSILDRRRPDYIRLHRLLRIFLRYCLSYMILLYGMDKVIQLQFPAPSFSRLLESYGDSSPMVLMWTFMGYSTPYSVFGGLAEVAAGILLLFRRTTLLGALLCVAVMLNVAVMDFSYDVSVKLFSVYLVLTAGMLVLPDAQRLCNLLLLNRPVAPAQLGAIPREPRRRWTYLVLKTMVVVYLLLPLTVRNLHTYRDVGAGAPKPPLYGLYKVDAFRSNGQVRPALLEDAARWRYVAVESRGSVAVKHMDDTLTRYNLHYDPATKTATIDAIEPVRSSGVLAVKASSRGLHLDGTVDGQQLNIDLESVDTSKFLLISRGFHWINETSFFH